MELLIAVSAIAVLALAIGLPATRRNKNTKKRTGGTMGGAMFAMNEIFAPSAHNAALIIEEQKLEVKRTGNPEVL